jgi:hypothetical protein
VQMSYDPGWRARLEGRAVPVFPDQLGMTVIAPHCSGPCSVDLEFTEGPERTACSVAGGAISVLLLGMLVAGRRRNSTLAG